MTSILERKKTFCQAILKNFDFGGWSKMDGSHQKVQTSNYKISFEDVIYSMVTTVSNTVVYIWIWNVWNLNIWNLWKEYSLKVLSKGKKKKQQNYWWWWMLTRLIVVTILKYIYTYAYVKSLPCTWNWYNAYSFISQLKNNLSKCFWVVTYSIFLDTRFVSVANTLSFQMSSHTKLTNVS